MDSVTKPSPFESNALNSLVNASTTDASELSVSWPKRGEGATADCEGSFPTRGAVATSAVATA